MQVTTSRVGGLLPRQIQRILPICFGFVFLILLFSRAESLGAPLKPADVLKRIISYQMPIISRDEFPKKIWQTWKVGSLHFEARDLTRARTWTSMNPIYRYEVLTDDGGLNFVETYYGPNGLNRPDIVYVYKSLTAVIIKADLLRYLVMYIEGGVYADIDVEALKPVVNFLPSHIHEKDVDLVISVEIDEPSWANHTILGPKSQSFCQWTFMCKPRVPVIMRLIDNIVEWLNNVARLQHVPISEIALSFDEVISGTGPSAFTTAVLREMSAQTGRYVHWDQFHALKEPKRVGNILVLTVEAFAAGQGHSNSGDHDNPKALVKHHYHASLWPDKHPRYSHPAYGMVEECNWNKECVDVWDINTAAYKTLPEDQQEQLIAIKVAADKEIFDKKMAENEAAEREAEAQRKADFDALCHPKTESPAATQTHQIVFPHSKTSQAGAPAATLALGEESQYEGPKTVGQQVEALQAELSELEQPNSGQSKTQEPINQTSQAEEHDAEVSQTEVQKGDDEGLEVSKPKNSEQEAPEQWHPKRPTLGQESTKSSSLKPEKPYPEEGDSQTAKLPAGQIPGMTSSTQAASRGDIV